MSCAHASCGQDHARDLAYAEPVLIFIDASPTQQSALLQTIKRDQPLREQPLPPYAPFSSARSIWRRWCASPSPMRIARSRRAKRIVPLAVRMLYNGRIGCRAFLRSKRSCTGERRSASLALRDRSCDALILTLRRALRLVTRRRIDRKLDEGGATLPPISPRSSWPPRRALPLVDNDPISPARRLPRSMRIITAIAHARFSNALLPRSRRPTISISPTMSPGLEPFQLPLHAQRVDAGCSLKKRTSPTAPIAF